MRVRDRRSSERSAGSDLNAAIVLSRKTGARSLNALAFVVGKIHWTPIFADRYPPLGDNARPRLQRKRSSRLAPRRAGTVIGSLFHGTDRRIGLCARFG